MDRAEHRHTVRYIESYCLSCTNAKSISWTQVVLLHLRSNSLHGHTNKRSTEKTSIVSLHIAEISVMGGASGHIPTCEELIATVYPTQFRTDIGWHYRDTAITSTCITSSTTTAPLLNLSHCPTPNLETRLSRTSFWSGGLDENTEERVTCYRTDLAIACTGS